MALYDDKIVIGCRKQDGKVVCYAYDLSTMPIGSSDPTTAKRKCEIIFDGTGPQFFFTGKDGIKLCETILTSMSNIVKKSANIDIHPSVIEQASKQLKQEETKEQ